jgi:hypothetical protein
MVGRRSDRSLGESSGAGVNDARIDSASPNALLSQTKIFVATGEYKRRQDGSYQWAIRTFSRQLLAIPKSCRNKPKERTEPGPSNVDSGARSARCFSEFYDTITRFSLVDGSGSCRSITGHRASSNRSHDGRLRSRRASLCFYGTRIWISSRRPFLWSRPSFL